jgi:phosphatidate cytidylyltransferase
MLARIASAAVGIPLGILIVFGWGGVMLAPVVGLLAIIGVHEFYRGARRQGSEPLVWLGSAACFLIVMCACYPLDSGRLRVFSLVLALFLITGLLVELFRPQRAPIRNVGTTVLGVVYVGWLLSFFVSLRYLTGQGTPFEPPIAHIGLPWLDIGSYGAWLVLFLLLITWACDSGAYFTGRFLGKHKLAPSLSPGKTIEGLFGGLTGATVISLLTGGWVGFSIPERVVIGLILGLLSVIGDLAESAMKREVGIKDFGAIMPGHGGVLDRLDSLLFAAPALYFFVLIRG